MSELYCCTVCGLMSFIFCGPRGASKGMHVSRVNEQIWLVCENYCLALCAFHQQKIKYTFVSTIA